MQASMRLTIARFALLISIAAVLSGCRSRTEHAPETRQPARDASHAPDADEREVDGWRQIRWNMGTAAVRDALTRDGIAHSVERTEKDPVGPRGEVMHVVEEHVLFTWRGASADAWLINDRLQSIDFEHRDLTEIEAEEHFLEAERRFGAPVRVQKRELAVWRYGTSSISVTIFPYPGRRTYLESWTPYGPPRRPSSAP